MDTGIQVDSRLLDNEDYQAGFDAGQRNGALRVWQLITLLVSKGGISEKVFLRIGREVEQITGQPVTGKSDELRRLLETGDTGPSDSLD